MAGSEVMPLDAFKAAAAQGRWLEALRIADVFLPLGDDVYAVRQALRAAKNPQEQRRLGVDPDEAMSAGIAALQRRFALT
jgi:hypothetical protein